MTLDELKATKDGARFFSKVIVAPSGCWEWTAYRNNCGYGQFCRGGSKGHSLAHRWIMEQIHGPPQKGLECCHSCNNRACVNPEHIYYGTRKQNTRDTIAAGRHYFTGKTGEKHPSAVMDNATVRWLREQYEKHGHGPAYLSRVTGIHSKTIGNVLYNKNRYKGAA